MPCFSKLSPWWGVDNWMTFLLTQDIPNLKLSFSTRPNHSFLRGSVDASVEVVRNRSFGGFDAERSLILLMEENRLTSWYGESTIIYGVLSIPGGAAFLPSTVRFVKIGQWLMRSTSWKLGIGDFTRVGWKIVYTNDGSMWLVYLPTFTIKNNLTKCGELYYTCILWDLKILGSFLFVKWLAF